MDAVSDILPVAAMKKCEENNAEEIMNTKLNNWFIDPESIFNYCLRDNRHIDTVVLNYTDYASKYMFFIAGQESDYLYKYYMGYVNDTFPYRSVTDKINDSFGTSYGNDTTEYEIIVDGKIPFPHLDTSYGLFVDSSRKNDSNRYLDDYDLDEIKYYEGCGDGSGAGTLSGANIIRGDEE